MMAVPNESVRKRLSSLEQHLRTENPLLVQAVEGFRRLSSIGYTTGLLGRDESYATQVSWWPLISVLGTFSAGKSTFINQYLGVPLQDTGNQAVDDKFTVVCYSGERDAEARVLPGLALDSDPRFPFYQTSEELEHVAPGEGRRIDAYLQLKTCRSERLKGRIIIDSPGFDADAQRTATLRLTNHIIGLSDLVLVFFDARHPEPGAMSDTLAHLVRNTIDRADSSKFLYILNQIDTAAREDNPEEVVGAWQRALAREGLTAGRFYCIYSPDVTLQTSNEALRRRFEWKRDQDLDEILSRIQQVSVERVYRIMGTLQNRAQEIQDVHIPRVRAVVERWRTLVLQTDALLLVILTAAVMGGAIWKPQMISVVSQKIGGILSTIQGVGLATAVTVAVLIGVHFTVRHWALRYLQKRFAKELPEEDAVRMGRVLYKNARFWRSIFEPNPAGWSRRYQRRLQKIMSDANQHVQSLNDHYTDPAGKRHPPVIQAEVEADPMVGEVLRGTR